MRIPKDTVDRLLAEVRVEKVAEALRTLDRKGKTCSCPKCQKTDGMKVDAKKQILKCFGCGAGYNAQSILKFIQDSEGVDRNGAIEWLASFLNMGHIMPQAEVTVQVPKKPKPTSVRQVPAQADGSFRDRQLRESGITDAMQRMDIEIEEKGKAPYTVKDFNRYQTGTIDHQRTWGIVDGVDMVMHYIGLDRKPMTFVPTGKRVPVRMFRCRFQSPEAHVFHGKPTKYLQPPTSGLHLWLPNKLIADFNRAATHAPILTIQEGEKKADRVCQVVPSVGIIGIHGLANADAALPSEFERIMDKFGTTTVIMFIDADLFELGRGQNDSVDSRPRTFAKAVKKYRQHFHKLQSENRRLNILMAHPTTLELGIKGMDDLMASGRMGNDELAEVIANGVKGIDHEYIKFYDLTTRTDEQIDRLWHLTGTNGASYHSAFANHYRDQIRALHPDTFRLGKLTYRFNDNDELELAQPMKPDEQFYTIETNEKGAQKVVFSATRLVQFLSARNIFRFREKGNRKDADSFSFIRIQDKKVERLPIFDIRDYVLEFMDAVEGARYLVRDHFRQNHESLLGQKIFSLLPFEEPRMLRDGRTHKILPFDNGVWTITPDGVDVKPLAELDGSIWNDQLIHESPAYGGNMFLMKPINADRIRTETDEDWKEVFRNNIGRYTIEPTEAGKQCVYLTFLANASNFYWNEQPKDAKWFDGLSADQQFECQQHLLAKLTAMGHLLRKYRIEDADYDIFAMEGNLIEDDRSDGRSGKSLFSKILAYVCNVVDVDGKKDPDKDIYIWDKVTSETYFVSVDDAHPRLWDIPRLYSRQTGPFGVRAMNQGEKQIPYEHAPHFYISSNWNLLKNDDSTVDRWRIIMFSNYYSAKRKPQDMHGHLFFREWDDAEKGRFFSLVANACQAYFLAKGVIQAEPDRSNKRMWEKEIGTVFKKWADATFITPEMAEDGVALRTGEKIAKLTALGLKKDDGHTDGTESWSFYGRNPEMRKYIKEQDFKRKLWLWCLLRDLVINPGKECKMKTLSEYHGLTYNGEPYGGDHKAQGIEYFTIISQGQKLQNPAQLPDIDEDTEEEPF